MSMDVSFLIPAYNEQQSLPQCLRSIIQYAPYDRSWEVIVCDNYSLDDTLHVAQQYDHEHKNFRAYRCEGTVGRVRNFLADAARGNVLVFLDADTVLTKDWAAAYRNIHVAMSNRPRIITGSRLCGITDESMVYRGWFAHIWQRSTEYINAGHLIVNADEFHDVGGFDDGLVTGEDVDFCRRVRAAGIEIIPDPNLEAVHQRYPSTVKEFFKRERWHAAGDYQSLSRFGQSRPAIAGTAYVIAIIFAALGNIQIALAGAAALVLMPVAMSIYKFPRLLLKERLINIWLSTVYLVARGLPKWGVPR